MSQKKHMKARKVFIYLLIFGLPKFAFTQQIEIRGKIHYKHNKIIKISEWSEINQNNVTVAEAVIEPDSSFCLIIEIKRPGIFTLNGNTVFLDSNNSYFIEYFSVNQFVVEGKYPGDLLYFNNFINVDKPSSNHINNREDLIAFDEKYQKDSLEFVKAFNEFNFKNATSVNFKIFIGDYQKSFSLLSIFSSMKRLKIELNDNYFAKYKHIEFSDIFKNPIHNNYYGNFLRIYSQLKEKIEKYSIDSGEMKNIWSKYKLNYLDNELTCLELKMFHWLCNNASSENILILEEILKSISLKLESHYNSYEINEKFKNLIINNTIIDKQLLEDVLYNSKYNETSLNILFQSKKDSLIVIDFWASWCGPCIKEFPSLKRIKIELKDKKITFLTINVDENIEKWNDLNKKYNLNKDSYYLKNGFNSNFGKRFLKNGIPKVLIFDTNGLLISQNFLTPSHPLFNKSLNEVLVTKR